MRAREYLGFPYDLLGDEMRPVLHFVIILSLFAIAVTLVPFATAQNVASASCASFKQADKDPAQQAVFLAYLQGYANASSPDPRYVPSDAAFADYAKNVRDWCGKNPKSTYAEAVAAVLPSPTQSASDRASSMFVITSGL